MNNDVERFRHTMEINKMLKYLSLKEELIDRIEKKKFLKIEWILLWLFSYDSDALVRSRVAKLLCRQNYSLIREIILYRMTYDRDYMVKLEAVDSLCIARSKKSLQRVKKLTEARDSLIRAYAYMSLIDIVENRNIKSEKNYCMKWISRKIWREKSFKARFMAMSELYLKGQRGYWPEIVRMIDCQIMKGLPNFWLITNVLEDIADVENKEDILKIIQRLDQYVEGASQKKRLEDIRKEGMVIE